MVLVEEGAVDAAVATLLLLLVHALPRGRRVVVEGDEARIAAEVERRGEGKGNELFFFFLRKKKMEIFRNGPGEENEKKRNSHSLSRITPLSSNKTAKEACSAAPWASEAPALRAARASSSNRSRTGTGT